jgi:UDP-N-acetylmuramyl pentapeptide synthase
MTAPAIRLSDLLRRDVPSDPVITGVTADSRKVGPGSLFVALPFWRPPARPQGPRPCW